MIGFLKMSLMLVIIIVKLTTCHCLTARYANWWLKVVELYVNRELNLLLNLTLLRQGILPYFPYWILPYFSIHAFFILPYYPHTTIPWKVVSSLDANSFTSTRDFALLANCFLCCLTFFFWGHKDAQWPISWHLKHFMWLNFSFMWFTRFDSLSLLIFHFQIW